jgi:hypothetical protein
VIFVAVALFAVVFLEGAFFIQLLNAHSTVLLVSAPGARESARSTASAGAGYLAQVALVSPLVSRVPRGGRRARKPASPLPRRGGRAVECGGLENRLEASAVVRRRMWTSLFAALRLRSFA